MDTPTLTSDFVQLSIALNTMHSQAMDLAEEADLLRRRKKDKLGALKLFEQAFLIEKRVADVLIDLSMPTEQIEPTRSILVLSAAALAKDADKLMEMDYYASKVIEFNHDAYFVEEALSLKSK
jgi:hypothetical protein